MIFGVVGKGDRTDDDEKLSIAKRFLELSRYLEQKGLTATMTFFWHGVPHAPYPKIPDQLLELFTLIPIEVEIDFDRDEDLSPRRAARVAT
jgi:hypothetical protein